MTFLLTTSDLQSMNRLVGTWLPSFAAEPAGNALPGPRPGTGDASGVALDVDADSEPLRGPLDLEEVTRLAEAFRETVLAVEIVTDRLGVLTEYAVSAGSSGAQGLLESMPRALVRCSIVDGPLLDVIAQTAGLPSVTGAAFGDAWSVASTAYNRCDDLAVAGDEEGAVAVLTASGVAALTAKAWVAALCGRGSAVAITVVRRFDDGRLEAGELRWVADESGGAWRIDTRLDEYVLTPADEWQLFAALTMLCEGERS